MRKYVKLLCCVIAVLTILSCFAACGGSNDETTATANIDENDENGRDSVKDDVPTNLNFSGESVTFFVRDNLEMWKKEMDVNETINDTLYDAIFYRNTAVEDRLGVEIDQIS